MMTNSNIKTIYLSSQKTPCKCGNYPTLGGKFWYRSNYDSKIVEGIVAKVYPSEIQSTTGVVYKNHEIEVRPIDIIRNEKLDQLGI